MLVGHFGGARVPSSRMLAAELSVSRLTVTTAYRQLVAEGYLVTRHGSGTFVAQDIPHLAPPAPRRPLPSTRSREPLPFAMGLPDQSLFPHALWAWHLQRAWRAPKPALLHKGDAFGWLPLRSMVCEHLAAWRGLEAAPEQVVITAGAADALDIIARAALRPGAKLAIEDPGWPPVRALLTRLGLHPLPLRIDGEGLDPARIPPNTSGAIVTPSRHYPTGTVMPLARRAALLHWAGANSALVVEDDYDSEFRYEGQPLPSLAGLDGLRRTLYVGSFSKLLSPSFRIGYLVLPEALVGAARDAFRQAGSRASLVPQPALASFMASGEFATHLRRMRRTYARRQAVLVSALAGVADQIEVHADPAGMHLCTPLLPNLAQRTTDVALVQMASARGLTLSALSAQSALADPPQALLIGYASFAEDALRRGAGQLAALLGALASASAPTTPKADT